MYTFILMVIEYFENGTVHWYMFFILFILIRWIIVQFFALQYRPYRCENKDLFSTVIVPVVDEPLDLFNDVLIRIADQNPNEVIIVVNGPPNPRLVNACKDLRRHLKKTGKYESIFILNPTLTEEATKALVEKFTALVSANGELVKVDEWGKRRMAYAIEDLTEGYYVLVEFESNPAFPAELDRVFRITDGVMRSIIIAK